MMKIEYYREKNISAIVCYICAVIIWCVGLFAQLAVYGYSKEIFWIMIPVTCITIFIFSCGWIKGKDALKYRKYHQFLRKNGRKYNGKVKQIVVANDYYEDSKSYKLLIRYYNEQHGEMFEFLTPVVNFEPALEDQISCDVYEFEGEQIADNFTGYTSRTNTQRLNETIQILLIITGIILAYLVSNELM